MKGKPIFKSKVKKRRTISVKNYLRNNYQLYLMLVLPLIYLAFFKYRPMFGTIVAFKK
jgi:putative aldouronate transport system permease protein